MRRFEGLEEQTGVLWGDPPPTAGVGRERHDHPRRPQSRRQDRAFSSTSAKTRPPPPKKPPAETYLNCFAYTGLFGLLRRAQRRKSVTDVEISPAFNALNEHQWAANTLTVRHATVTENVFDYLHTLESKNYRTDMVILDPPAFTKNRASREPAMRGYHEINRLALRLLRPGGVLVTCSCSHHLSAPEFQTIVENAARDTNRQLRLIERRGQPADHPILLSPPNPSTSSA